ncbi:hypothetical protein [Polluticoccus soli]|uniref:hypothetical protein n=1 Tax=Polluticoccus soli TaxID=3034150 RepID=UPI0023E261C3|nr:hypothetical protein [Flavipsychrobacter sp. JY13-12]
MKVLILFIAVMIMQLMVTACPVCERNKPKTLKYISIHGTGPESNWDYVIVIVTAVIALVSLFLTIKWLIRPKEDNKDHIKYSFLNPEQDA